MALYDNYVLCQMALTVSNMLVNFAHYFQLKNQPKCTHQQRFIYLFVYLIVYMMCYNSFASILLAFCIKRKGLSSFSSRWPYISSMSSSWRWLRKCSVSLQQTRRRSVCWVCWGEARHLNWHREETFATVVVQHETYYVNVLNGEQSLCICWNCAMSYDFRG